jgi:hypothetical protein
MDRHRQANPGGILPLSPRERGWTAAEPSRHRVWCPLSPRERGWTDREVVGLRQRAVVPARAGMDRGCRQGRGCRPALSPRERGWTDAGVLGVGHDVRCPRASGDGPRRGRAADARRGGCPRASGDGPQGTAQWFADRTLSPRERGWTAATDTEWSGSAVVPARAGMDRNAASSRPLRWGCPRASGDGPKGEAIATRTPSRCPRASGDGPQVTQSLVVHCSLSPRERGWTAEEEEVEW